MTSDQNPSLRDPHSRSIRILLADDHAVVRDGLRMILEAQAGMSVVGEAGDGREAVRQSADLRPDVAVLDITMPELNGIEATRLIGETCPDTQVVILSMHDAAEHVYNALAAGACGYAFKGSSGREVADAVSAAHAGRRFLSDKITDALRDGYVSWRWTLPDRSPLEGLTLREREVLQMVAKGKSSKEIAVILELSPKTVETHRGRMMRKLGVGDLPALFKLEVKYGLRVVGVDGE